MDKVDPDPGPGPVPALKTVSLNVQEEEGNVGECAKRSGEEHDLDNLNEVKGYPFAAVLRIRVLQIVCGISSMIMGTVGFIEEKGELNLGLSIPAGAVTIIAAGASIHTSRGFGGYKPSSCAPRSLLSHFRFLGPSVSVAGPLTLAWATAFLLHVTLCALSCKTLAKEQWITVYYHKFLESDVKKGLSESTDEEWNTRALAAIILILSVITVLSTMALLRIDCLYDPD